MSADWAALVFSVVAGLATAAWAILKFQSERKKNRLAAASRLADLYYNPFLLAAEALQSRLYNVLCAQGLVPLSKHALERYPQETLHLVAEYFAYEQFVARNTPDLELLKAIQQVRKDFASDADGLDPWCIFRPAQRELGRMVLLREAGRNALEPETLTLSAFEAELEIEPAGRQWIDDALDSLRKATKPEDLGPRSVKRLMRVQSDLVDLLDTLEQHLARLREVEAFSVFPGGRRKRSIDEC